MNLTIHNCPDEKFEEIIDSSVYYFASQLIGKNILKSITINLKFVEKLDSYGTSLVTGYNQSGKPRVFEIEVRNHLSAKTTLKTIAHEIVHVKQFAKNEVDPPLTMWKGKKIDTKKVEYYKLPWEIEAYGLTYGLYINFCIENKLWEHLKGIENPYETKKEKITWKDI